MWNDPLYKAYRDIENRSIKSIYDLVHSGLLKNVENIFDNGIREFGNLNGSLSLFRVFLDEPSIG